MRSIAIVASLTICWSVSAAAAPPSGTPAALVDVDAEGLLERVRDGKAPLTVVNVWATWCAPCKEEFPDFIEVERAYRARGVRVWFVSTDFGEDRAKAVEFLRKTGARLPSFIKTGKDEPFIEALSPKWVGTLPATVIFDRSGRRLRFFQGRLKRSVLEQTLDSLLGSSPKGESK
ncbi:MAG: TlpA disulfide reductase family protein [Myxococcota bacterium]